MLGLVVNVSIQQIHKFLILLFNFVNCFLKLPNLLIQLILREGLLIKHAVKTRNLILLLIDRPSEVLTLIVKLIEASLEVLVLCLPLT